MTIPAAMFIEEAKDMLCTVPPAVLVDQRKELHEAMGSAATEDFSQGYELGLQVARVILMQSPKAVEAGVGDIL